MQLLADISGRVVSVPAPAEIPARGAALFGAVAGGAFPDIAAAVEVTQQPIANSYEPDPRAVPVYERVYEIYRELHETLGRSHSEWLHGLKRIRADVGGR
jgi:L-ribulokinase